MTPEELVEGTQYVVSHSIGDGHSVLDPGDLVVLKVARLDSDGMVFVNAEGTDGAAMPAWVHPEHLVTVDQFHEELGLDEDECVIHGSQNTESPDSPNVLFQPHHPDYEWLPAYNALPLGYALGLIRHFKDLGQPAVDPALAMFLQARGFPTA